MFYKKDNVIIKSIDYDTAVKFLLPLHYSGRIPSISYSFGMYIDKKLSAVLTIGKPASYTLCDTICGKNNSEYIYELNRLCRLDDLDTTKYPLSMFVSKCLKYLKKENMIIVSFSDTQMNHNGYIYQACNFLYTGLSKVKNIRYDGFAHQRHHNKNTNDIYSKIRQVIVSKHRYIYYCTNSKTLLNNWKNNLKYKLLPYPKGKNKNYKLGKYILPKLILFKNKKEIKYKNLNNYITIPIVKNKNDKYTLYYNNVTDILPKLKNISFIISELPYGTKGWYLNEVNIMFNSINKILKNDYKIFLLIDEIYNNIVYNKIKYGYKKMIKIFIGDNIKYLICIANKDLKYNILKKYNSINELYLDLLNKFYNNGKILDMNINNQSFNALNKFNKKYIGITYDYNIFSNIKKDISLF